MSKRYNYQAGYARSRALKKKRRSLAGLVWFISGLALGLVLPQGIGLMRSTLMSNPTHFFKHTHTSKHLKKEKISAPAPKVVAPHFEFYNMLSKEQEIQKTTTTRDINDVVIHRTHT